MSVAWPWRGVTSWLETCFDFLCLGQLSKAEADSRQGGTLAGKQRLFLLPSETGLL